MPNSNKDMDLDRGYDSDKSGKQNSDRNSRYNRDSLDNYNDNLSKRAVGSIFNNIDFDNPSSKDDDDYNADKEDFTIDTNFSIKSNTQRKQVVSDFFADDDAAPKRKPKNSRPTRLGESTPNPIVSKKQLTNNNSAFTTDDDTLYNKKYVTRGNHMAVTPAMAAKRKNKTMMESQRIPTVTDEEIEAYKSTITLAQNTGKIPTTNTSSHTSYISSNIKSSLQNKQNTPEHYDTSITAEQKEIYDYLQSEIHKKELDIENTMYRINEKTKHYNEIIESTNKKYTKSGANDFSTQYSEDLLQTANRRTSAKNPVFVESPEENDFNENNFSENSFKEDNFKEDNFKESFDKEFNNYDNSDFDNLDDYDTSSISDDDLDQDFEDTIASNYSYQEKPSRQSRPLIPTNNLSENKVARRGNDSLIKDQETGNFYDVETDTYVTQKTKFNTGEVTLINDTVATEISLEDLDELVFDNYDTTDMEFLRQAIKEKSQARKMQVIDEQFSEFEKKHRDFGHKNVPPKTSPRPRPNRKPEPSPKENDFEHENHPSTGRVTSQRQRPETRDVKEETEYNSYEYRKSQTAQHSQVDEDDYNTGRHNTNHSNTGRHNTDHTGRHNNDHTGRHNIENTGRYNTSHTGRIPPTHTSKISTVDLDADYDDYEDYSKRYNISLAFNIFLAVAVVSVSIFTFLKVSSLSDQVTSLSAANAELVEQNNKINELQIDVDYYKDLYQNTEEGKARLEAEKNGETSSTETDSTDSTDSTESTSSSNSSNSTSTSTGSGKTYTVESGDTLSSISKKMYGTSNEYKKIMEANNLTSENVSIGQVLIIP